MYNLISSSLGEYERKGGLAMAQEKHHVELIEGISEQLKPILDKSDQAVFIYLDDTHKVCNKKYASLLGYKSVDEWVAKAAPLGDVLETDQKKVIAAYEGASEKLDAGSVDITLKNVKTNELIKTKMIITPTVYQGHILVIQFFAKI
jgi:hypothetical protein